MLFANDPNPLDTSTWVLIDGNASLNQDQNIPPKVRIDEPTKDNENSCTKPISGYRRSETQIMEPSPSNHPSPHSTLHQPDSLLVSFRQASDLIPQSESTPPNSRDILSEAELGLMWLQRRAELIRLEIQTLELELALQQARSGTPDTLLSWLKKNGKPWQDHLSSLPATPAPATTDSQSTPSLKSLRSASLSTTNHLTASDNNILENTAPKRETPTEPKPRSQKKPYPTAPQPSSPASSVQASLSSELKPKLEKPRPLPSAARDAASQATENAPRITRPIPQRLAISKPTATLSTTATRSLTAKPSTLPKAKQIPSWLVSTLVHVALLILLMLFTIQLPEQKQTLGLSGSFGPTQDTPFTLDPTATADPNALENEAMTAAVPDSLSMENMLQNSLPTASDIANNVFASTDIANSLSQPTAQGLGPIGQALDSQFIDALSTTSSLAAANFFGLEATGNIFCFVVDCSGSMRGDPFVATKLELLKTISQLKPTQRFCVFFFNQKLFPMPLEGDLPALASSATEDFHPVAAYATPENIGRLQNWMETIPIGTGGPPNQALKMAIELNPDSIFLLTDGVTRSDVAGGLLKTNRQEDELDGPQIRCPIHTIGFYSREGEALLQRIATENGGQYRYVPNPQPPKKSKKMERGN